MAYAVGLGTVVLVSGEPITPEQRAAVIETMRLFGMDAVASAKVVEQLGSLTIKIDVASVCDPR
jgi:hypothetical protein